MTEPQIPFDDAGAFIQGLMLGGRGELSVRDAVGVALCAFILRRHPSGQGLTPGSVTAAEFETIGQFTYQAPLAMFRAGFTPSAAPPLVTQALTPDELQVALEWANQVKQALSEWWGEISVLLIQPRLPLSEADQTRRALLGKLFRDFILTGEQAASRSLEEARRAVARNWREPSADNVPADEVISELYAAPDVRAFYKDAAGEILWSELGVRDALRGTEKVRRHDSLERQPEAETETAADLARLELLELLDRLSPEDRQIVDVARDEGLSDPAEWGSSSHLRAMAKMGYRRSYKTFQKECERIIRLLRRSG